MWAFWKHQNQKNGTFCLFVLGKIRKVPLKSSVRSRVKELFINIVWLLDIKTMFKLKKEEVVVYQNVVELSKNGLISLGKP